MASHIAIQQFQVPQFITVEDKAIGGVLTIKQAAYIIGAGVLGYAAYSFFEGMLLSLSLLFIGALAASLAWLKISGVPFTTVLKNFVIFLFKPRLFLWKKEEPSLTKTETKKEGTTASTIPKLSESKLSDLAWSLDIKKETRI